MKDEEEERIRKRRYEDYMEGAKTGLLCGFVFGMCFTSVFFLMPLLYFILYLGG